MNWQIAKRVTLALFSLAILAAPVRAAANNWNDRRAYAPDHRHARGRDDSARRKERQCREHQRALEPRNDGTSRYSDLTSAQNYGSYHLPNSPLSGRNTALNQDNYLQSGATQVGNQLATGYANLQTAYANALAAGDRSGAQHYLNALKQQQKEIAQYNAVWGSTAGTIATSALPSNNYLPNSSAYTNNTIYPNPGSYQTTGVGLTPYNAAQIDPRLGAATALLLMGQQMIHP